MESDTRLNLRTVFRFDISVEPESEHEGRHCPRECPVCSETLELVQPDQREPDRLLGVCLNCRKWHLFHVIEGRGLLIYALPGNEEIYEAMSRLH